MNQVVEIPADSFERVVKKGAKPVIVECMHGRRIQEFFVGGKRLDRSKSYAACFVTVQGVPERYGNDRHDLDADAIDALKEYLAKHDKVSAEIKGSIIPA